jgi:hypothetical protein
VIDAKFDRATCQTFGEMYDRLVCPRCYERVRAGSPMWRRLQGDRWWHHHSPCCTPADAVLAEPMDDVIDAWNKAHPKGTVVKAYRGAIGDEATAVIGPVWNPATVVGGTPVAWIKGGRGCIALSHVVDLPKEAA